LGQGISQHDANLQNEINQAGLLVAEIQRIALGGCFDDAENRLATIEAIATAATRQIADIEAGMIAAHALRSSEARQKAGLLACPKAGSLRGV
jgi:hypothetical protein